MWTEPPQGQADQADPSRPDRASLTKSRFTRYGLIYRLKPEMDRYIANVTKGRALSLLNTPGHCLEVATFK